MAQQQFIASNQEGAEIYHGESICKQKSHELLTENNLPKGMLPLNDLVEVGYNRATGFVWMKQKNRTEHKFRSIGKKVYFDTQVTAFVENRRMRKVTGVKTKEFWIWVTISDIYIDGPDSEKVSFGNPTGLARSVPISAFELNEN